MHREMSDMTKERADAPINEVTEQETPAEELTAEGVAAAEDASVDPDLEVQLVALREQVAGARQESAQLQEDGLRARAELDNLRKRSSRELENAHKYALDRFAQELLPVRDSLELGLASARQTEPMDAEKLVEGSELTLKMLTAAMEKFGIHEVVPEGEKFNPDLHQAMATQQVEGVVPGTVVTVYQKGYTLNERLLRPAMVIVAA